MMHSCINWENLALRPLFVDFDHHFVAEIRKKRRAFDYLIDFSRQNALNSFGVECVILRRLQYEQGVKTSTLLESRHGSSQNPS
jgi:hypothetical protein